MSNQNCQACGRAIPPGSVGALCPRCVLGLAAKEPSMLVEASTGPRLLGDYELEEEIARGGMGTVFRARQRSVDRTVAVKMVRRDGVLSPDARLRFQIEAEAIAKLDHAHIIALYESGEVEGQLFYSMRYVDGGTLRELLADEATPLRQKVQLLAKVARAVHYAHTSGVLHRDLKPTNILIDGNGEPVVVDFGLAKLVEDEWGLTQTESLLGSPNYMAPEQASHSAAVTTAADVYSLGAILYEMLCGVPPFRAETPLETIRRVVDEEVVAPSKIRAQQTDLEWVCLKCLEKSPDARYRSAAALADELETWLAGDPVAARSLSRLEKFRRWTRRERGLAAALGLVALLLVSVAVVSTVAYYGIRDANQQMQAANRQTEKQLYLARLRELDDSFEKGNALDGVAQLARMVRWRPDDRVLRRRLFHLLRHQSIPKLSAPYVHLLAGEALAWGAVGAESVDVIMRSGQVIRVDPWAESVRQERGPLGGAELQHAAMAGATLDIAVADREGNVAVYQSDGSVRGIPFALAEPPSHLDLSAKGSRVATVRAWRHLGIWDVDRGQQLNRPIYLPQGVSAVRFSQDGRVLAAALSSGGALFFDAQTGALKDHYDDSYHSFHDVDFSADRQIVGLASPGGAVVLWNRHDQQRIEIDGLRHATRVNGVRVSSDGRRAVSFDASGQVKVWRIDSREPGPVLSHIDYVSDAAFSRDGKRLVTGGHDRTAQVWDVETGTSLCLPLSHTSGIAKVAFGEQEGRIRVLCYDGTVWHWSLPGALSKPKIAAGGELALSSVFHPYSGQICVAVRTAAEGWKLRWIEVASGTVIREIGIPDRVAGMVISDDGTRLAFRMGNSVQVRDFQTGEIVGRPVEFQYGGITSVALSSSGESVAIASQWEAPRVIDLTEPEQSARALPVAEVESIQFVPKDHIVVTSHQSGPVKSWDVSSGSMQSVLASNGQAGHFSQGGRYLPILQGERAYIVDRSIQHWLTGQIFHESHISDLVISPDARWLATASMDKTVQVWSIEDGQIRFVHRLWHLAAVTAVAFDPSSEVLISGSDDGAIRLWDLATGHPLSEWLAHDAAINALYVGPKGEWFSAVTQVGSVATWSLNQISDGASTWLPALAEYVVRREASDLGRSVPLDNEAMRRREQQLQGARMQYSNSQLLQHFSTERERTKP